MKKYKGNIGDLLTVGICILGMTIVMMSYMKSVSLIQQKTQVNQIARKYILRMETVGYLDDSDQALLYRELEEAGVTELDLGGTTLQEVAYGEQITLQIRGKLEGVYTFDEKRVSTAKH